MLKAQLTIPLLTLILVSSLIASANTNYYGDLGPFLWIDIEASSEVKVGSELSIFYEITCRAFPNITVRHVSIHVFGAGIKLSKRVISNKVMMSFQASSGRIDVIPTSSGSIFVNITAEYVAPPYIYYPRLLVEVSSAKDPTYDELFLMYENRTLAYHSLEQRYNILMVNYNRLEENYTILESEYWYLNDRYDFLTDLYNELMANYSKLEEEYIILESKYSRLEEGITKLSSENEELKLRITRMESMYKSLKAEYDKLRWLTLILVLVFIISVVFVIRYQRMWKAVVSKLGGIEKGVKGGCKHGY